MRESDVESIVRTAVQKRMEALQAMDAGFRDMQRDKLLSIVRHCAETEFGTAHGFGSIASIDDYRKAVPPSTAVDYDDAWKRIAKGERNVLFPDPVYAFGLSSGTTGEPKTVPLTKALVRALRRAIGYTTCSYMDRTGNFSLLRGYALQMAAPTQVREQDGKPVGYITGIMGAARPYPFHQIGIPSNEILDLLDWSEKYKAIEERYADFDVRMIFGIPGYILGLLHQITANRGIPDVSSIWPDLSLVVTSGVALRKHQEQFETLCPSAELLEMYLCTEAAIACQPAAEPGMLPMVEDLFLEFVPEDEWGQATPTRLHLGEVETGVRYVVLVTTPSGLYAYAPGDVVRFIATDPPRLLVEGRYGNVLSLASEKLDEEQAEQVLRRAEIPFEHFTVCPADGGSIPGHEWVIQFAAMAPADAAERIDAAMRAANPLYNHLREGELLFSKPKVTTVAAGTFERALNRRPGQGKILRIYQDRKVRDELVGT